MSLAVEGEGAQTAPQEERGVIYFHVASFIQRTGRRLPRGVSRTKGIWLNEVLQSHFITEGRLSRDVFLPDRDPANEQ